MQANSSWIPPLGALGRLCARAHERAKALDSAAPSLRVAAKQAPRVDGFASALRKGTDVALIAEIKRRSPSSGVLNDGIRAAERADQYRRGGAAALSVLTEPTEFGGSNHDVQEARIASGLPILKKDFHVAPSQVWEARSLGASAILLIARALGPDGLRRMLREAEDVGLEALVEIRSEAELDWALESGASVIGVNSRDLETLRVEPEVHEQLIVRIPPTCIAVGESGIVGVQDVEKLAVLGADAVLVGSALSASGNAAEVARSLSAVIRRGRAA